MPLKHVFITRSQKYKPLLIWFIGFFSGFCLMITGNSLNFWLAKEVINIEIIGIFSLVAIPYSINFLWAPIFDIVKLPYLYSIFGQRVSWLITTQLLIAIFVLLLSIIDIKNNMFFFASIALVVSFLSSTQDTILGAIRTEIIDPNQQGEVSGVYIFGYRIGMLISSSGAIYISSICSWQDIYKIFAAIILLFPIITITLLNKIDDLSQAPVHFISPQQSNSSLLRRVKLFFQDIISSIAHSRQNIRSSHYLILILCFLILYRLPDNLMTAMINPFLLQTGYKETEIATIGKFWGVITAILGGIIAGYTMKNSKNIFYHLLFFGSIHALAHLLFLAQEIYGKNILLLFFTMAIEGITGGMTMAAYIGFIASLCNGKYRATQYSFLSSMMGISRSLFPALSGYLVLAIGWKGFFLFCSILAAPSLIILFFLIRHSAKKI